MHMSDALLIPAVAGTMYACSTAAAGYSVYQVKKIDRPEKVQLMGVMGAFVFAAQMINFTIPGTGSSGHLCGGMMLSAVLGPEAGFLSMIGVLLIQCLLFADGGLMALGANVWNMAFYGCFIGGYLIWNLCTRGKMSKPRIVFASIAGCVLTLQMGAFSVTLQTVLSQVTELPFLMFVSVMQPIHLAIGVVEGLITAAVLVFLYEMKPQLLWNGQESEKKGRVSTSKVIVILLLMTAFVGGMLSLFASAFPDGLEWSMEKVAGTSEIVREGGAYDLAARIQEKTAVLPDYGFSAGESVWGTTVSGLVGAVIVMVACMALCYVFKLFRKNHRMKKYE